MSIRARHALGQLGFFEHLVGGELLVPAQGILGTLHRETPWMWFLNSVVVEDPAALPGVVDELAAAYAAAGVGAWAVWLPGPDEAFAALLAARGLRRDGTAEVMGAELADVDRSLGAELDLDPDPSWRTVGELNDVAYDVPAAVGPALAGAHDPASTAYVALQDGEPVACLALRVLDGDAYVSLVAVAPAQRGRGLAGRLLSRALAEAHEQGVRTTTLDSTALGRPVYDRLGYTAAGAMEIWVHAV